MRVAIRTDEDDHVCPLEVQLHGKTYVVEEVLRVLRRSARRAGSDCLCYTVRIGTTVTGIYYEDPRWFA